MVIPQRVPDSYVKSIVDGEDGGPAPVDAAI